MKLSVWAKKQGITYKSAWNMYSKGLLPIAHTPYICQILDRRINLK